MTTTSRWLVAEATQQQQQQQPSSRSTDNNSNTGRKMILMDMVQINPGDTIAGQQQQGSKYSDPNYLKSLGYTARATSMEQSPALCMTYQKADRVVNSSSSSIFEHHRNSTVWVDAYCQGIQRMLDETTQQAGLDLFFFTDMIVFPNALIELYPEVVAHSNDTTLQKTSILYNNYTEYLLRVLFDEWFERFPSTSGIIVRTGETYTFDTPYHSGSSPIDHSYNPNELNQIWVRYINLLRQIICVQYQKKLIFRTWFSITDVTTYEEVTQQIRPHPHLYFSIKHTVGDFFRQMSFNPILSHGDHAQLIEIQIQREYEGKGAYPLYIFEHIVFGDISSGSNQSLSQLFPNGCKNENNNNNCSNSTTPSNIIQGLWTWSRGGGWWGPYIHSAEFWIDLNVNMFLEWWNHDHCTTTTSKNDDAVLNKLFQKVCTKTIMLSQHSRSSGTAAGTRDRPYTTFVHNHDSYNITSSLNDACTELRQILLLADQALLYGRYCLEVKSAYGNCWIWTRDDRIGGLNELQAHMDYLRGNETRISESLYYKQQSLVLWKQATTMYETKVSSTFSIINPHIDRQIRSSFLYAQSYFCIIESAWRALIYGTVLYSDTPAALNQTLLNGAISDYDACWNMFQAIGLITPEFPSLYKGIYWNFPYEPENEGMDATINRLRNLLLLTDDDQGIVTFQ